MAGHLARATLEAYPAARDSTRPNPTPPVGQPRDATARHDRTGPAGWPGGTSQPVAPRNPGMRTFGASALRRRGFARGVRLQGASLRSAIMASVEVLLLGKGYGDARTPQPPPWYRAPRIHGKGR